MHKFWTAIVAGLVSQAALAQAIPSGSDLARARVIELEKSGWTAWKNRDARWYAANTIREAVWINADGVTDKTQFLKELPTACKVASFALADYRFALTTRDMVIMSYTATQDAECGGKKLAPRVRASVVYVRRAGRWLEAMSMETPLTR